MDIISFFKSKKKKKSKAHSKIHIYNAFIYEWQKVSLLSMLLLQLLCEGKMPPLKI